MKEASREKGGGAFPICPLGMAGCQVWAAAAPSVSGIQKQTAQVLTLPEIQNTVQDGAGCGRLFYDQKLSRGRSVNTSTK